MAIAPEDLSELERALVAAQLNGSPFMPFGGGEVVDETASWGADRTVRADVLRALLRGENGWAVTERGLQLAGLRIDGDLDLEFIETLPPLRVARCRVDGALVLRSSATPALTLSGSRVTAIEAEHVRITGSVHVDDGFSASLADFDFTDVGGALRCAGGRFGPAPTALSAEGARVGHDVQLGEGFDAQGSVRLGGVSIGGQLACGGGRFRNKDGFALNFAQARIRSDVLLRDGFAAYGEVALGGAEIGGQLSCTGGVFECPGGDALTADNATISGGVFLASRCRVVGSVRLLGARIGSQLVCSGSFTASDGVAIGGDDAVIAGGVFFDGEFSATGQVALTSATIGGQLNLAGPSQACPDETAFMADGVTVRGSVFLTDGFTARGQVRFRDAEIGGQLSCRGSAIAANEDALNLDGAVIRRQALLGAVTTSVRRTTFSEQVEVSDGAPQANLRGARFEGNTRLFFDAPLQLEGIVLRGGPLTLVPRDAGRETTLDTLAGATLEAPLVIPDGVSMSRCDLRNVIGLGNLRVTAADPGWPRWRRRRILPDELAVRNGTGLASATTVEGAYRELRAALESSKAAPAAADFYYGEMEMRRLAAPRISFDRSLLWVYKMTSGYGLRAWRALISYAAVVLAVAAALYFQTNTFVNDVAAASGRTPRGPGLSFDNYGDVVALVARSSVSFLSPITSGLTAWAPCC